ncbi:sugar kinase [Petrotoga olearia]|uniref:2-dehydro-3-deoxygluconokinase n=2 Tax=Petrotoga olearia TaxID=156203 RepID=A0A2K1P4I4_9BACT|nr:sugar kinase [Petrotoga olearia]PNR97681.1 2-dehydro-3-deoxygluconokinase [Petrotoga olearia DSM 13574]RMA76763.1 2-dehydro-3-deoxygluconokinase [Petrotoga olearia]
MANKIVTFGEIMMRLSPPKYFRFVQTDSFDVTYGGAEANVAASLANYGENVYFVTKVPDNPIGQSAINHLRRYGVKTDYIIQGGERLGIYFHEFGASQRPSLVIYDRKYSSFAESQTTEYPWDKILDEAKWFHFTGITPAVSENAAQACLDAVKTAKNKGIIVSCDLNYRKKLWSSEKANEVMSELMKYVDVLIANEEAAEKVFNIKAKDSDVSQGNLQLDGYKNLAKQISERFDLKGIAITLRESFSAFDNGWAGLYYDGSKFYCSKKYQILIVDRVGGGDSFAGGLIYALINNYPHQEVIEFATAASCLKHSIIGDFNHVTLEEVKTLTKGDSTGRIQR